MLRKRIFAAVTTAALMLGMSVGGAGAAVALVPSVDEIGGGVSSSDKGNNGQQKVFVCKYVDTPGVNERLQTGQNPISVAVSSIPNYQGVGSYFADQHGRSYVLAEDNRTGGGQQGEPDVSECPPPQGGPASAAISITPADCVVPTSWNLAGASIANATWGAPTVSGSTISITATAVAGSSFPAGEGVSPDGTTKTFTADYAEAGGEDCAPPVALAAVSTDEANCFVGTTFTVDTESSSNVTWSEPVIDGDTISITAIATGGALFEEGLSGVNDDRTERTFTAAYQPSGGDDCVLPTIDVTAAMTALTCVPGSGSFTAGLFDANDPNADTLLWTTTEGTVPSATANTVDAARTVVVTVRVADAYLGDYALNDTSGLGEVSVITVHDTETALITFTFTFTAPDDCSVDDVDVVVPEITVVDMCDGRVDDTPRSASSLLTSFTLTRVAELRYSYTVNGGDPVDVVFADGEDTTTITVKPLDTVIVTATPVDGFALPDDYEPWSYTFDQGVLCTDLDTFPTTEAAAEIVAPDCLGNPGSITLTNGLGVIWTLNGEVVAGNTTHTVPSGTVVELVASLEEPSEEYPGGFGWNDPEQQTVWNAVMEVDQALGSDECLLDEDELLTLAFTGTNGVTAWLGLIAAVMVMVGMGFVIRRHRVTV